MKRLMTFVFLAVLVCETSFAKNFYLTVRRDYSPEEEPQVELIYNKDIPIRMRLLKPKNMDAFIKEQIDLRRAWKEPRTEVNSARSLIVGFNKSYLSVDWIRNHFTAETRKDSLPALSGAIAAGHGSTFQEGPTKLIRAPEGFDVVTDFALQPEEEDKSKPFDVPGFWYSSSNYKTRLVNLPKQQNGFYVLQVLQGTDEGQVVVVVNNVKAMLQQTDGVALVRTTTRTGEPIEDAEIKIRNVSGAWIGEGETDGKGVSEIKTGDNTELVAAIQSKYGTAIVDTEFLSSAANVPDVFIYTDRPMYKPEGIAQFKAIFRQKDSGVADLLNLGGPVTSALLSGEDSQVAEGTNGKVTEFGSVSGEVPLTNASSSGIYRVQTSVDGMNHTGEIRVKDYQKPLFFVKATSSLDSAKAGQRVPIKIKAERYAGGAPVGVTARLEVLRMRFDGPEWVEDAGKSEKANETTYGFRGDEEVPIIPISVLVNEGLQFSGDGTYSGSIDLPAELPGDSSYDYKLVVKVTAQDSDGNFAATSLSLLEATSDFMMQARSSAVFGEKGQKAWVEVRALTPGGKPFGKIGGTAEFFHTAYGESRKSLESRPIASDATGKIKLDYPTGVTGVVSAKIVLKSPGGDTRSIEEEVLIAEPGSAQPVKMVSDMTVVSRKSVYNVGETSKALVLLPEKWGIGGSNAGYIYTTVAGTKIFSKNAEKITGQSYWINLPITEDLGTNVFVIVAYSDPRLGFVERRIQYQIIPEEKILKVNIAATENVVAPGGEQTLHLEVKDHENKPVRAELSVSVVDRAVLDLQPEFRPQLLEFFYPKDRLNMMTFYSNEFQSYGYSETIAKMFKPNYWFAATKPAEEKQKEEDTAYWNPAVVTDGDGKATVKFRLPINQTIWKTTVVAIDKDGRFGESSGEFKAQTETPITLAMPDKIRKGESFAIRINATSLSKTKNFKMDMNVKLAGGLRSKEAIAPVTLELRPGQSETFRHMLDVDLDEKSDQGTVEVAVVMDGKPRMFTNTVKFLDGYDHSPMNEPFQQDGRLDLILAKGESLTKSKVRVFEGFTGAVMPALHWMMSYPHGCVEQLTNTTIPNLAIADIFAPELLMPPDTNTSWWRRMVAGIKNFFSNAIRGIVNVLTNKRSVKMTEHQKKTLEEAVKNARLGVDKLSALQKKDGYMKGALEWFEGIDADSGMHYYVMMSLLSVERPELVEGIDLVSLYRVLSYQNYENKIQDASKNVINRYIRSQLNRLKLTSEKIGSADLRFSLEASLKEANPLLVAYALRTVQDSDPSEAAQVTDVRKQAQEFIAKSLDDLLKDSTNIRPAVFSGWSEYLGRRGSTIAILARALYGEKIMGEDTIERVRVAFLQQFNGRNFGTTFETGQILLNSTWLIRHEMHNRRVSGAPEVKVDGKTLSTDPELILAGWEIPVAEKFANIEKLNLSVAKKNPSDRAILVGYRTVPLSDAKIVEGKYKMEKHVYRLDETTQDVKLLGDGETVKIGDLLYIENKVQTDPANLFSSSYYLLENDIPSGTSVVDEDNRFTKLAVNKDTAGWKKREEIRGRLNYYFAFERGWSDKLRQGSTVGFIVRVNFNGKFNTGVSRFMDFYDEENYSQSRSYSFNVEPAVAR